MTEPAGRQIAVVRDYDELIKAMSQRAIELQITRKELAEVAGIADGSTGALAPGGRKSFGRVTLGPMLGALGLELVVREDPEALKHVKNRVGNGKTSYMLNGVKNEAVKLQFSRRHMRKLGIMSGQTRTKNIPKRTRSRIARQAAKARWNPPQLTEMTPQERERYLDYQAQKARRAQAKAKRRRGALPTSDFHVITRGAAKKEKAVGPSAAKRGPVRRR